MGTGEREIKNSLQEPSLSGKSSDKSSEKFSEMQSVEINQPTDSIAEKPKGINILDKVKFEVYGEEVISKEVKQSGNSGRVYLPPDWIGKHIKIIRID
jgi:putative transposon-encoded protein